MLVEAVCREQEENREHAWHAGRDFSGFGPSELPVSSTRATLEMNTSTNDNLKGERRLDTNSSIILRKLCPPDIAFVEELLSLVDLNILDELHVKSNKDDAHGSRWECREQKEIRLRRSWCVGPRLSRHCNGTNQIRKLITSPGSRKHMYLFPVMHIVDEHAVTRTRCGSTSTVLSNM